MLLAPPKDVPAAETWRALLAPRPAWPVRFSFEGVEEHALRARALSSAEWVRLHRAIAVAGDRGAARAEADLLASVLEDGNGARVFGTPEDVLDLHPWETIGLVDATYRALEVVSPTMAGANMKAWITYLRDGAMARENLQDAISLGGCHSISWGFGKGAVHVRDEPEQWFGIPRRDLLDAHWFAYYAAVKAFNEVMR